MAYETESWPVIPARWFTRLVPGVKRSVRVIVIHTMEAPEGPQTAENVARYFARGDVKASAHVCVDVDSVIQCVADNSVAYAAPGANHDGIQIEIAGYAKQIEKEWMDAYGIVLLNRVADVTAQYCLKYSLSATRLTNEQLRSGQKGIIGHNQVSAVYKKSTHTDPGPNFPWEYFLAAVRIFMRIRS